MQQEPNPSVQQALAQIDDLVVQTRQIVDDIDQTNKEADARMDELGARVDESVNKLQGIFSTLKEAEDEAADELDKLILQQAEYLAEE